MEVCSNSEQINVWLALGWRDEILKKTNRFPE
jgi:hypothetical protein